MGHRERPNATLDRHVLAHVIRDVSLKRGVVTQAIDDPLDMSTVKRDVLGLALVVDDLQGQVCPLRDEGHRGADLGYKV